jgi:hypothetical protein
LTLSIKSDEGAEGQIINPLRAFLCTNAAGLCWASEQPFLPGPDVLIFFNCRKNWCCLLKNCLIVQKLDQKMFFFKEKLYFFIFFPK